MIERPRRINSIVVSAERLAAFMVDSPSKNVLRSAKKNNSRRAAGAALVRSDLVRPRRRVTDDLTCDAGWEIAIAG
jgi:hypothetical protein